MTVQDQIKSHISSQSEPKRTEMQELHQLMVKILPKCKLWFDDGASDGNRAAINPTIGYGIQTLKYANGSTKEFFQIGLSANKTGISVYIIGIKDKSLLAKSFGKKLGKASVTGYCIKFKTLKDINKEVLEAAIKAGIENSKE